MKFPWTIIFETADGTIHAKNVLAKASPIEALQEAERTLKYDKVLGMVKGSHADYVYGIQILQEAEHKDQLAIPFVTEGHTS